MPAKQDGLPGARAQNPAELPGKDRIEARKFGTSNVARVIGAMIHLKSPNQPVIKNAEEWIVHTVLKTCLRGG